MKNKTTIHPTAIIGAKATIANNVMIGPYCVIGDCVEIEEGTTLLNNVTIQGNTNIGRECTIFTNAVIGNQPQDLKYKGEKSSLLIGRNNIIREFVTINPGTEGNTTVIGDHNLFMAYGHIAHDCRVGNHCVFANNATLAGHVTVEDRVTIGGLAAIHQFVQVGTLAIIGGCSKVVQDVPPYSMYDGHPAKVYGINSVGLKRANISKEAMHQMKSAFKILFHSGFSRSHALAEVEKAIPHPSKEILHLISFVKNSKRGIGS